MSNIKCQISNIKNGLAILLDPEKADLSRLSFTQDCHPDFIFVGGSTGGDTTDFIKALRLEISKCRNVDIPIILFPGNAEQFSEEADAILFLSLLSGNNPEYLIGQQIRAARNIHDSHIDVIPTAYILIDGGVETSTMRVTKTEPLKPSNLQTIIDTCIAAELMGKKAIYLEAGSGAEIPVSPEIIRAIRNKVSIPLIVGGGIRTPQAMNAAYEAGANIVVIGNHFESHPEALKDFCCHDVMTSLRDTKSVSDEKFMRLALCEAEKALAAHEIPIGCVIVSDNQIIGRGHNLTETLADVTAHAEIQAITAAAQTLGGKYLPDATLYVTVEPCPMCAGAIGWAQIKRIVYGAPDPKRGYTLYAPHVLHPKATVTSGVLETECRALVQEFFRKKRS